MNEQLSKIIKNPATIPSIVGVLAFGAGGALGYFLGKRNKYEVFEPPPKVGFVMDAEDFENLQKNDHFVNQVESDEESEDDSEGEDVSEKHVNARDFIAERLAAQVITTEDYIDEEPEEESIVENNIFAASNDDWNHDEEVAQRNPAEPYVIHKDEFWADEKNFHQITLTYYQGDEMMADQEGQLVYNYSTQVGPLLWGHGSGDPDVFYVRNEKNRAEFEIIRDEGYFSEEVLGQTIEHEAEAQDVKHSNSPRRFQMD